MKYHGITHPEMDKFDIELWRVHHCSKNEHVFDEVKSLDHYLVCDACGLTVHIAGIETEEEVCARIEKAHDKPYAS